MEINLNNQTLPQPLNHTNGVEQNNASVLDTAETTDNTDRVIEDIVEISTEIPDQETDYDAWLTHYRATAPKIDWENRTLPNGDPLPDIYHKEPTEAMLNGTQHYSIAYRFSGERLYVERNESAIDSNIRVDASILEGAVNRLEKAEERLHENTAPDTNAQKHTEFYHALSKSHVTHALQRIQESYDFMGVSIDYAHDVMKEISDGRIDLIGLMMKYL